MSLLARNLSDENRLLTLISFRARTGFDLSGEQLWRNMINNEIQYNMIQIFYALHTQYFVAETFKSTGALAQYS